MRVLFKGLWYKFQQFFLDLFGCFTGGKSRAVAHAKDMRIDCDRRMAERDIKYHIGGFAADSR